MISAGSSTVRGLVVNFFPSHGIVLQTVGGNRVDGNYIGTDKTGSMAQGNGFRGISIVAIRDNVIGGNLPGQRNVIS